MLLHTQRPGLQVLRGLSLGVGVATLTAIALYNAREKPIWPCKARS